MKELFFTCFILTSIFTAAQTSVQGIINSKEGPLEFATVYIKELNIGVESDKDGKFQFEELKKGVYTIVASFNGYFAETKKVTYKGTLLTLEFYLKEHAEVLNEVTVTGTKTDKRKTDSPVIVNVINSVTLQNVQACNLSEGLKFQTGLRVETDCQTCNYTQLRMNGLGGGYSQILINGRPVFSPLTGLYGLEQIPTNMIDKIEVVRGGGSALYGSSAIGGTVNVITKIPKRNDFSFGYTFQSIDGTPDHIINGNATLVNDQRNAGISFFINHRNRGFYDANGDHFSELPELKNNAFGTSMFFLPAENQKLEFNFSKLNEYRFGGEIVDLAAHLTQQAEERTHDVYVGNIDYQINFNEGKNSLITYLAAQYTNRDHYTGVFPDDPVAIQNHLENPPYGISDNTTWQWGVQYNHKFEHFLPGNTIVTVGTEYVQDDVLDVIEAYNYRIDQLTKNLGFFFQNDWELNKKFNILTGFRVDDHNFVDNIIVSPRVSFLYKPQQYTQIRATWGTGFRAPQAFDSDLHIAFAGGGVSRISLSDDLKQERSNSYSVSINYDKPTEHYIYGFTIEGFYTKLNDAFFLFPLGEDAFGERFEKRNGDGATVQGIALELRANFDQVFQIESGFTIQSSLFDTPVENSDVLPVIREFLRTPNNYGFATFTYKPNPNFTNTVNFVYTGKMKVLHLASPNNLLTDEYFTSPSFLEVGFRSAKKFYINKSKSNTLEVFGGVKNLFNAYQDNFDIGKDRDSNFIFGPATPRTFFVGVTIGS